MRTGFSVADAMTKKPVMMLSSATVKQCAVLMVKHEVSSILVMDKDKIAGIITEGDIIRKVVSKGKSPASTKVNAVMTKKVASIPPQADMYDALVLMRDKNIKTLPVVAEGKVFGMLTIKDILKIEPDLFDIVSDMWTLKEEKDKPIFGSTISLRQL